MIMVTVPVMGAGGNDQPKNLFPYLDVKLAADWRYSDAGKIFVSLAGSEVSPATDLPKGTEIRYMVPHLAKTDRTKLSPDEANLAQFVQIVFPEGTIVDRYLAAIEKWACVRQVQRPPNVSLP
jgi:hypothetical protein